MAGLLPILISLTSQTSSIFFPSGGTKESFQRWTLALLPPPSLLKRISSASSLSSPFLGRRNCMKRMRLAGASSFQSLGVVDLKPSMSTRTPLPFSLSLSAALDSFAEGLHAAATKANIRKPITRRIGYPPRARKQFAGRRTFLSVNGMLAGLARGEQVASPLPLIRPSLTLEEDSVRASRHVSSTRSFGTNPAVP